MAKPKVDRYREVPSSPRSKSRTQGTEYSFPCPLLFSLLFSPANELLSIFLLDAEITFQAIPRLGCGAFCLLVIPAASYPALSAFVGTGEMEPLRPLMGLAAHHRIGLMCRASAAARQCDGGTSCPSGRQLPYSCCQAGPKRNKAQATFPDISSRDSVVRQY